MHISSRKLSYLPAYKGYLYGYQSAQVSLDSGHFLEIHLSGACR
jgi:hypothetical protein